MSGLSAGSRDHTKLRWDSQEIIRVVLDFLAPFWQDVNELIAGKLN